MYSFLLRREISGDTVHPCYFFYGEEMYLAEEFIQDLKDGLISPEGQEYNVETFNLEERSWMDVMDTARTVPFFFSSWRILVVSIPPGRGERFSSGEEKVIKAYFSSPPSHTVLVILFHGKLKKASPLLKLFLSFPPGLALIKELKPLRDRALLGWIDRKLSALDKDATPEARSRLVELAGNSLSRLSRELEKVASYVGEKRIIEPDDINAVSGWVKSYYEWEILDALEKADFRKTLHVLENLFKEGARPESVLGLIAKFFRDIFQAKIWLMEKRKNKRAVFRELRPHIPERFGDFYAEKFRDFFSVVEKIPLDMLKRYLSQLAEIDVKIKTSDLTAQTLIEGFLFGYCRDRKALKAI
ncbi:MAG: DNA polymerase III subunit delta [Candidatus Aminicenantales bacterium]